MKRRLVLTPKFQRAFRKYVRRDVRLQERIAEALQQMEQDLFVVTLGAHKLSGTKAYVLDAGRLTGEVADHLDFRFERNE